MPDNLLTCVNARANCVNYGTAVGCCISSDIQRCTDIATSCVNWSDLGSCNDACQSNPRNLICDVTTEPYCGTYFFGDRTSLFGCRSYSGVSSQVLQLTLYYSSLLGPGYETRYGSITSGAASFPTAGSLVGSSRTTTGGSNATRSLNSTSPALFTGAAELLNAGHEVFFGGILAALLAWVF
jgi:hypothetical protein